MIRAGAILFWASLTQAAAPPLRLEITLSPRVVQNFSQSFRDYLHSAKGHTLIRQLVFGHQQFRRKEISANDLKRLFDDYQQWLDRELGIDAIAFDQQMPPLQVSIFYPQSDLRNKLRQLANDAVAVLSEELDRGPLKRMTRRWSQGRGILQPAYDRKIWEKIDSLGPKILASTNRQLAASLKSLGRAGSVRFVPDNDQRRDFAAAHGSYAQLIAPAKPGFPMEWVDFPLNELDKRSPTIARWVTTQGIAQLRNQRATRTPVDRSSQPLVKGDSRFLVVSGGFGSCTQGGQNPLEANPSPGKIHPQHTRLARRFIQSAPHRRGDTVLFVCFDLRISGNAIRYQLGDFDEQGRLVMRPGVPASIDFNVGPGDQLEPPEALNPLAQLIETQSRNRKVDLMGHSFGGGLVTYLAKHLNESLTIGTLATLDAISFFRCKPEFVAHQNLNRLIEELETRIKDKENLKQSLQAVLGLVRPEIETDAPSPGCTTFPPEYDDSERREIAHRIKDNWFNAFERETVKLHSAAILPPAINILNKEITDLGNSPLDLDLPGASAHSKLTDSDQLWSSLGELLRGRPEPIQTASERSKVKTVSVSH